MQISGTALLAPCCLQSKDGNQMLTTTTSEDAKEKEEGFGCAYYKSIKEATTMTIMPKGLICKGGVDWEGVWCHPDPVPLSL
ncbi:hypothetical protein VNO80_20872 [Phaseolus coccineus]|uniref:Uncharacterized protein n=1 Tax=Phaseolus coccineus TaxID=3886 RepID=A0AAN9QSR0_PHACN